MEWFDLNNTLGSHVWSFKGQSGIRSSTRDLGCFYGVVLANSCEVFISDTLLIKNENSHSVQMSLTDTQNPFLLGIASSRLLHKATSMRGFHSSVQRLLSAWPCIRQC